MRLVMDCRLVNPFLKKRKVKLENLVDFRQMLTQGMFAAVDDLESGYHQLRLDPKVETLFGCVWTFRSSGKKRFFVAKVLFLGLADAVYAFTKVL